MPLPVDIADRLRSARVNAGITQRELAQRAGITQSYFAIIETGRRKPSANAVRWYVEVCRAPELGALAEELESEEYKADEAELLRAFQSMPRAARRDLNRLAALRQVDAALAVEQAGGETDFERLRRAATALGFELVMQPPDVGDVVALLRRRLG